MLKNLKIYKLVDNVSILKLKMQWGDYGDGDCSIRNGEFSMRIGTTGKGKRGMVHILFCFCRT